MASVWPPWDALVKSLETYVSPDGKLGMVRVLTSDGVEGWGQLGNRDVDLAAELFHRRVAPAFHGRPVCEPSRVWDEVMGFELNYKCMGTLLNKAMAGLDSALCDAWGKRLHKSVSELFGAPGPPTSFPVYASSISRQITAPALADELERLHRSFGIRSFKVKVGKRMQATLGRTPEEKTADQWPGRSEEVLTAVRARLGPGIVLSVDANGAYPAGAGAEAGAPPDGGATTEATIERVLEMLRTHRVAFLEEPFAWHDWRAYRNLRAAMRRGGHAEVPVAGGEQEFRNDVWEMAPHSVA
jgi:L-alanine-DL-glutamate epimerase-like enolase superfamily enzyme